MAAACPRILSRSSSPKRDIPINRKPSQFVDIKHHVRSIARKFLFTQNTLRYQIEWARIEDMLCSLPPADHLVDGGAGSGEFVRLCLKTGFAKSATALEFDPQNFAILKQNLGRHSRVRELIHGSLLEVPLPDACADLVMTTQVLEHIEEHEKAAAELIRILKPGGYALVSVPHPPEPFPNDGHVREGYTEGDLRSLIEPLGCDWMATEYFFTRRTIRRMLMAEKLPFHGVFLPVAWLNAEKGLSAAERKEDTPFGIMTLFRKRRD
jgi:ubiquinone/menaquinone biosynthesis C-methylase UbiE